MHLVDSSLAAKCQWIRPQSVYSQSRATQGKRRAKKTPLRWYANIVEREHITQPFDRVFDIFSTGAVVAPTRTKAKRNGMERAREWHRARGCFGAANSVLNFVRSRVFPSKRPDRTDKQTLLFNSNNCEPKKYKRKQWAHKQKAEIYEVNATVAAVAF